MIREKLREARNERGMTQKAVSDAACIAQPYYHQIENGERRPSVETAKKIAAVLGFDWTMFYEDESQKGA